MNCDGDSDIRIVIDDGRILVAVDELLTVSTIAHRLSVGRPLDTIWTRLRDETVDALMDAGFELIPAPNYMSAYKFSFPQLRYMADNPTEKIRVVRWNTMIEEAVALMEQWIKEVKT